MRGGRGASRPPRGDSKSRDRGGARKVQSSRSKNDSKPGYSANSRNSRGNALIRGRGGNSARGSERGRPKFNRSKPEKGSTSRNKSASESREWKDKKDFSPKKSDSQIARSNSKVSEKDSKPKAKFDKHQKSKNTDGDKAVNGDKAVERVKQSPPQADSEKSSETEKIGKKKAAGHKAPKNAKSVRPKGSTESAHGSSGDLLRVKKTSPTKARHENKAALAEALKTSNDVASSVALDNLSSILPALSQYEMDALTQDASHLSGRWTNKQRVLCLGSRGMRTAHRFLLADFKNMLPHHIPDVKWEKKLPLDEMTETADLANCNNILYLETRRKRLLMWLAKSPSGPSVKFEVMSVQTSEGTNYIGNCLKYSRPVLVFDSWFDSLTQLKLIKELFIQIVGTPRYHPASKPFHDHVVSLFYNDGKIWFRHYQIFPTEDKQRPIELREIGPRFCLEPIRIFAAAFGGKTLWKNPQRFGLEPRPEGANNSADDRSEVGQEPDIFTSSDEDDDDQDDSEKDN